MEEEIKSALQTAIRTAYALPDLDTNGWTRAVYQSLLDLGHALGFKVCVSRLPADSPEWLFDVVWYTTRNNSELERLEDIPMVMECEWNRHPEKIAEDFEKLLSSNAPLKVMICYPRLDAIVHMLEYFRDSIANYKQRRVGDKFLIGTLDDENKDLIFNTIIVE